MNGEPTPSPGTDLSEDLALALELADLADRVALERFRSADLAISTKPDRTFVTESDLAVERAIRDRLAEARPSDGILGEEFGRDDRGSRQWIVDPIDGTSNFLRGVPVWGALISLAIDGTPVVGVASMPTFGRRWWAARGHGAWTNATTTASAADAAAAPGDDENAESASVRRVRVSGVADLADASLSFQSIAQWRDAGRLPELLALGEAVWRDRAYGDLWSYMLLAEGLVDIVGEFDVKEYDLAALVPIVEEAGGVFTSVDGVPGHAHGSALATNGVLHEQVLAIVAAPPASGSPVASGASNEPNA
ncbi:histidinol-phosphate phosphatase [Agromyces sp. CF514]|uniref:inositol monophosphatase family protein n=1 Tax=Agromyces sp. CF514 TaxID=1881031 RepID=UPI0008F0095E|nr:inositol monophosphatase family protein [Agromyces sp. CF514]SFR74970.1 histidinol-phosphate phosphatase [Agromyces sp. CF514]